jgi:hypothetical protein
MNGSPVLRPSIALLLFAAAVASPGLVAQNSRLPNLPQSVKFAVIGDNGTGKPPQYEVGRQMAGTRRAFPFDLVLMLGDNLYGGQNLVDYVQKFERPYQALLDAGVVFQATLGNHDAPAARSYRPFNMNGERYYTFTRQNVRFFVLDTNILDAKQLAWADAALADTREPWKICYFHHPLYSNAGRHGSAIDVRVLLEPMLIRHRVDVVFSGHDHIYVLVGSSGQLRKRDLQPSPTTAVGFDRDQAFMLVEIAGAEMFFETRSRTGAIVDSGVISKKATMRETTTR